MSDLEKLGLIYENINMQRIQAVDLETLMSDIEMLLSEHKDLINSSPVFSQEYNRLHNDVITAFENSDYRIIGDLKNRYNILVTKLGVQPT